MSEMMDKTRETQAENIRLKTEHEYYQTGQHSHDFALELVREGVIGANTYNAIVDYLSACEGIPV